MQYVKFLGSTSILDHLDHGMAETKLTYAPEVYYMHAAMVYSPGIVLFRDDDGECVQARVKIT